MNIIDIIINWFYDNRPKIIFSCLLLFCVNSCGAFGKIYTYTTNPPAINYNNVIEVYLDKNFSMMEDIEIDNGLMDWNYSLNDNLRFVVVRTDFDLQIEYIKKSTIVPSLFIMKIDSSNSIIPAPIHSDTKVLAFTNMTGGNHIYLVMDRIGISDLKGLLMHEVGHSLGSEHHNSGLMVWKFDREQEKCVDYLTAEEVAKYHNWDIRTMNYCYPNPISK